jgi:hypothetical protein
MRNEADGSPQVNEVELTDITKIIKDRFIFLYFLDDVKILNANSPTVIAGREPMGTMMENNGLENCTVYNKQTNYSSQNCQIR